MSPFFLRKARRGNLPVRLNPAVTFVATKDSTEPDRAFPRRGKLVMLYRAQDASGTSRLGYAESGDGIHFTRCPDPVLSPETDYEKDGGVEDPRLQTFGDTYYLTYTGYNKKAPSFASPHRSISSTGSAEA
jgi:hypothetical protein